MGQIPTEYLPPKEPWPQRIYTLSEFTVIPQRLNSTEALPDQTVAAGGRVPGVDTARHRPMRPRQRQAPSASRLTLRSDGFTCNLGSRRMWA
jgi:hypothetical protein